MFDVSKTIEQNARKKIKEGTAKYFLSCINNLLSESRRMTTPLGKIIRTDIANRMDPTSRPTIAHLNQATVPGHNDPNHFPIGILNSGIDFPRSGNNIDNRTGMKPQGPTVTTIPDSNRANNCSIFESVSIALDIVSRFSPWYVTMKCES